MRKSVKALSLALVLIGLTAGPALAAGGSEKKKKPSASASASDATDDYNRGLKMRDRAWKFEEQAADASGADAEGLRQQAQAHYENAMQAFRQAVEKNPKMHEAQTSLGYSLRKLGRHEEALRHYDNALKLNSKYTEAIEYRAEAYLEMGRLEEAKSAYMQLFREDRPKADQLMAAMQRWTEERPATAKVSDADAAAFGDWVAERAEVAGQTATTTELRDRKW